MSEHRRSGNRRHHTAPAADPLQASGRKAAAGTGSRTHADDSININAGTGTDSDREARRRRREARRSASAEDVSISRFSAAGSSGEGSAAAHSHASDESRSAVRTSPVKASKASGNHTEQTAAAPKKQHGSVLPLILCAVICIVAGFAAGRTLELSSVPVIGTFLSAGATGTGSGKNTGSDGSVLPDSASEEASDSDDPLVTLRESLTDGRSVLSTLRTLYPDYLIIAKDNRYNFFRINNELAKHSYNTEQVSVLPSGEYQYVDAEGNTISHKGIDVSSHQGDIDWEKVKADGVEFAIIRALYRGYESGKLVEDKEFEANIEGAAANGINTGVYVFTQSINEDEIREEAEALFALLEPYDFKGPVVIDIENAANGEGRMDKLPVKERTELTALFCELVKEKGFTPVIYFNIESALSMVELPLLEDYEKWFAGYNADFYYPYSYKLWQYSDTGAVDGIDGNVDLDLYVDGDFGW